MNAFFFHTYYCWIVSRVAVVAVGVLYSAGNVHETGMPAGNPQPLKLFFSSYTLLMLLLAIKEFRGYKGRTWLNSITGVLTLLIASMIIVPSAVFNAGELVIKSQFALLFIIWIILLGLFDLSRPVLKMR